MEMYNATIEVAKKSALSEVEVDALMEKLGDYHPAMGSSPRGWLSVTVSLPAESFTQAASTALAVVQAACGADPVALEVMRSTEFDAREGWAPVPELMSVTEVAAALGVSRQAVLQRLASGSLPGEKVGNGWAIPRSAVAEKR